MSLVQNKGPMVSIQFARVVKINGCLSDRIHSPYPFLRGSVLIGVRRMSDFPIKPTHSDIASYNMIKV